MLNLTILSFLLGLPCSSVGKKFACNPGDLGLIPGSGRFRGEENGNPLQYSGLEILLVIYFFMSSHLLEVDV